MTLAIHEVAAKKGEVALAKCEVVVARHLVTVAKNLLTDTTLTPRHENSFLSLPNINYLF